MDGTTRIGIACLSLVILWVVVYWMTPTRTSPEEPPRVTFQHPGGDTARPEPTPGTDESAEEAARPNAPTPESPVVSPEDEGRPAVPRPGSIIPPTFVDYTVREGDNAWSVSERFYGSREHWAAVLLSNPTVDARRLFRVGRVIKLAEDPRNIQGIKAGEQPPPAPRMDFIEYRVESGDSLSEISKAIYGRASLWRFIQSANADQVNAEGTNLRPGMILIIPPPPAE